MTRVVCDNPMCRRVFSKHPHEVTDRNFCSQKCVGAYKTTKKRGERRPAILIPLTKGRTAIVDLVDSDLVDFNWSACHEKTTRGNLWYAVASPGGHTPRRRMHRVVLGRVLGRWLMPSETVDHINNNGLDNRRSNLRLVSPSGNSANTRKQRTFKGKSTHSKYKGVSRRLDVGRWIATIKVNRKQLHLGYFDSEIEAAKAYDRAARERFGEYAKTNFPQPGWRGPDGQRANGPVEVI